MDIGRHVSTNRNSREWIQVCAACCESTVLGGQIKFAVAFDVREIRPNKSNQASDTSH